MNATGKQINNDHRAKFAAEIESGLNASPRQLPSKYFYDDRGDELFQMIMKMPEYYLTDCEFEIFSMQKDDIARLFAQNDQPFRLIEFGAGDGTKTKILLQHLTEQQYNFTYVPIDISANVLHILEDHLKTSLPQLEIQPIAAEYFEAMKQLEGQDHVRNIVLFLGSNIGNFTGGRATEFLNGISAHLNSGDLLMIGMDLKKDPEIILHAYNDNTGITRAFNFNILNRINNELDANINTDNFRHWPVYDPLTGETKSYLVSLKDQQIHIGYLDKTFHIKAAEAIQTELSQKYDLKMIQQMASGSGFQVKQNFFDCKHWYVDSVWEK